MRKKVLAVGIAALLTVLSTQESYAQSQQDLAQAQRLYQQGDALEERDPAAALAKFEEALRVVETAQLRLRAGRCQEKLGKLVLALASYNRAVTLSEEDATLGRIAGEHAQKASERVPKLELKKPKSPKSLRIKVDGNVVTENPVLVDVGEHEVSVEATGFESFQSRVSARENEIVSVEIKLVPLVDTTRPEPASPVLPSILIGAGAALLGGAIGFGVYSAIGKDDAYNDLAQAAGCTAGDPPKCPWPSRDAAPQTPAVKALFGKIDESNVFLGFAIGSGVLAAAAGVIGITLLATGSEAAPAEASVGAKPWFSDRGGGVSIFGAF